MAVDERLKNSRHGPPERAVAACSMPAKEPLNEADIVRAMELLKGGVMFRRCLPEDLRELAMSMYSRKFARGEYIVQQGEATTGFWMVGSGEALRLRTDPKTKAVHHVDSAACGTTINSLQVLAGDRVFASARCESPEGCRAFGIDRDAFIAHLSANPRTARSIIEGLSRDARRRSKLFRTPLLQQRDAHINYSAVTIAAATESYYRSALNSALNTRLSGVKSPLFPNMHIQVPARVVYINGFKGLRALLDQNISPETYSRPNVARVATMVAPGILMTPVSSFLEACNAGHANPEPIVRRSLRGTVPRMGREIIFGVGINQVSDYFEERFRTMSPSLQISSNPLMASMAGSMTAGVIAGYCSHVPHNISTYKLLEPQKSYRELFNKFVSKSVPEQLVPRGMPDALAPFARIALACIFPRGVVIRTCQIVGSFVILNGGIAFLQSADDKRFGRVISKMEYAEEEEGSLSRD